MAGAIRIRRQRGFARADRGGVVVLVITALVIVGIGIGFLGSGVSRKFTVNIHVPDGAVGVLSILLGVFGYCAKGAAIALVGVLFGMAAFQGDASKGSGLDGALKSLRDLPYGGMILSAVGVGLIAYGLFCCIRARTARM